MVSSSIAAWIIRSQTSASPTASIAALGSRSVRRTASAASLYSPHRASTASPADAMSPSALARKSVVEGKGVYVRVVLDGLRLIKKSKKKKQNRTNKNQN